VLQREDSAARQRDIAETLQHQLLPDRLPNAASLEFATRYIPANVAAELGGDWYDVIALDSGRYGFVIGDVAGHGILSAAVMGKIRMALRAYALEGQSPAEIMTRMNTLLRDVHEGAMATVWYGDFDSGARTLTFTNAGHVPPIVFGTGRNDLLDNVHGPPIGAVEHCNYDEGHYLLNAGDTLLLYTDGLIERRGRSIDDSLATLRASVPSQDANGEAVCDALLTTFATGESDDDIALLAIHVCSLAGRKLQLHRPATPSAIPETRHMMQAWLADNGVTQTDAFEILTAVSEACANVVTHAYGLTGGPIDVAATLTNNEVSIVIRDDGTWRTRRPATHDSRSRGLSIMHDLMDHVDIETSRGTEVHMKRKLNGARHR
jgi:anti-sigma regulatory factor (Ser/Thr protein kinase)